MAHRFRSQIEHAARNYDLDPDLVEAVVDQESSGQWFAYRHEPGFFRRYLKSKPEWAKADPREVSSSYGLMQVMFTTAIECGFTGDEPWKLFDPRINLDLGCRYLAKMITRASAQWRGPRDAVGEAIILRSALAAYNGGQRGNEPDHLPDRNAGYAAEVLERLERIKRARTKGPQP